MSSATKWGSIQRSCSSVPQEISGARSESRHQRSQQQHLAEAHARVRRHLEGAELDESEPAVRPVGSVELVDGELGAVRVAGEIDEQVPQQPIDQPGSLALLRLGEHALHLLEGDVELVEGVVPGLVDAW